MTRQLLSLFFLLSIPVGYGNGNEFKQTGNDEKFDTAEYEEVKARLREIFEKGVNPQDDHVEEEEEDDEDSLLKNYPEQDFEPFSDTQNTVFSSRRRGLTEHFDRLRSRNYVGGGTRDWITQVDKKRSLSNDLPNHSGHEETKQFLNEWVIHLTGGKDVAASVAKDLEYDFLGQVGNFKDVYRLVKRDHPTIHKRAAPELTHKLNTHIEVKWAEQQFVKERSKRSMLLVESLSKNIYDAYDPQVPLKGIEPVESMKRIPSKSEKHQKDGGKDTYMSSAMSAHALNMEKLFNDELWVHQWYLFDTRSRSDLPKLDLQVVPVWQSGVTGKGVKLLILDDGLEWKHSDIIQNYNGDISYDFNDDDNDPTPSYDAHLSNSHGTRCAGEVAMMPNNKKCGVGVAYGTDIGGVRMLDGPVSDLIEGLSLEWPVGKADIISCSWGPTDDGRRVEGPGTLAETALHKGVTEGRDGKGIVYVWAAGNGGSAGDDCNCDGYTSSIYTLSISSASETGLFPWYGERCASTLATAYSSGAYTDQKIATTDLHDKCTDKFTGTSAAAPLAAGIFALALEVNPELTWRDMQHAVVWSSEWAPLGNNAGWLTNAKGLKFNPRFGFGLLSADAIVQTSRNWTRVPEKSICTVRPKSRALRTLKTGKSVIIEFDAEGCDGTGDEIRSLEHVQVIANINYTRRGALSIALTSPAGTRTVLLNEREDDISEKGFHDWALMSVHTWGEDPRGIWKLNITDKTSSDEQGTIGNMELVLHGTKDIPEHFRQTRSYKIQFEEIADKNEEQGELTEGDLSAEMLKTLPWEKLVELLQHRTRSTFSDDDIKMLLKEDRLEKAVRNVQSERDFDINNNNDWRILLNEVLSRK